MSLEYDRYLEEHKENVRKGFNWIKYNLPELIGFSSEMEYIICECHDKSKLDPEEYVAYDEYFYGNNRCYSVVNNFNEAWLRHIHLNRHHWQHWVLINDDPELGEVILDMPYPFIIEMICDWWSFSWKTGNLYEIFNWYKSKKNYIKLSNDTRKQVEDILNKIKEKLEYLEYKANKSM